MHVLLVTPFIPPKIGGIERHSENLVRELLASGSNKVTLLTSGIESGSAPWVKDLKNLQVVELNSFTLFSRFPIPTPTYGNLRKLRKLSAGAFGGLIVQSHLFLISTLSAWLFRKVKMRIWINHGSNFIIVNPLLSQIEKYFELLQIRIMRTYMNSFIAVSSESANWISEKSNLFFETINNGIPNNLIKTRSTFPYEPNTYNFLFVGRLIKGTGGIEAMRIFQELYQSRPKGSLYKLSIIGGGPELHRMRTLAKSLDLPIVFFGAAKHKDVIFQMKKSEVLLFSSTYPEGLSTVILEAMANGLLVASSALPGLSQFLQEEACIYGEVDELAELIREAIINAEQSLAFIRRAEHLIRKDYTSESMAKAIMERIDTGLNLNKDIF